MKHWDAHDIAAVIFACAVVAFFVLMTGMFLGIKNERSYWCESKFELKMQYDECAIRGYNYKPTEGE